MSEVRSSLLGPYELDRVVAADCLLAMREIPAGSVDLIVTDPPYAEAEHTNDRVRNRRTPGSISDGRRFANTSTALAFFRPFLAESRRILREKGHLLVFCDSKSYPVFYPPIYEAFDHVRALVWDKVRRGKGYPLWYQSELILAARWKGAKVPAKPSPYGDVLRFRAVETRKRTHPQQKPVGLLAALIEATTDPGDVVLDPFAGSGVAGSAAVWKRRSFLGFEKDDGFAAEGNRIIEEMGRVLAAKEEGEEGDGRDDAREDEGEETSEADGPSSEEPVRGDDREGPDGTVASS